MRITPDNITELKENEIFVFGSNTKNFHGAIEININDLFSLPNPDYPHKIAFKAGKVLYQCDKFGKKI